MAKAVSAADLTKADLDLDRTVWDGVQGVITHFGVTPTARRRAGHRKDRRSAICASVRNRRVGFYRMSDARVARLKILTADQRIADLRLEMNECEAKLKSLRKALVESLEARTEAMRELHSEEVYFDARSAARHPGYNQNSSCSFGFAPRNAQTRGTPRGPHLPIIFGRIGRGHRCRISCEAIATSDR